jgi:hypothetical protein
VRAESYSESTAKCNCHYLVGRAKRNKWKMMTSSLYRETPKKMRHVSVCSCQDIWPSISLCWAHYRLSKQQQGRHTDTFSDAYTQNFGQQRAHIVDDLSTVFPSQSTDHSRNRRRAIRFPSNQPTNQPTSRPCSSWLYCWATTSNCPKTLGRFLLKGERMINIDIARVPNRPCPT